MKQVCYTALLVTMSTTVAVGQERPGPIRSAARPAFASDGTVLRLQPAPAMTRSGDSVGDGAAVGAVIGGLGAALFGAYLCNAVGEEGDPPCWRGVLAFGAIGAGIGAASGAAIDALHSRSSPGAGRDGDVRPPAQPIRVGVTWRWRF